MAPDAHPEKVAKSRGEPWVGTKVGTLGGASGGQIACTKGSSRSPKEAVKKKRPSGGATKDGDSDGNKVHYRRFRSLQDIVGHCRAGHEPRVAYLMDAVSDMPCRVSGER